MRRAESVSPVEQEKTYEDCYEDSYDYEDDYEEDECNCEDISDYMPDEDEVIDFVLMCICKNWYDGSYATLKREYKDKVVEWIRDIY